MVFGLLLTLGLTPASEASAQTYPAKPITLVMPYPPGGGTDAVARIIAQKLEKRLGQPVIFEYRPGAGSAIAAAYVARQPADGLTILYATSTTMAINVSVHKALSYDPVRDFVPIALFAVTPFVLVVNASLPIHSVAELVTYAKSKPGALSYASNGPGGAAHLFAELVKTTLGIEMTHVPYKGNAPALNDVVAGHVSLMFVDPSASVQLLREGKLRALGVSTTKRLSTAPDLPPLAEVGLPGYDAASWHMFVAPAATPRPIVQRLYSEIDSIIKEPDAIEGISKRGFEPSGAGPPDQLALFVRSEIERWGTVVRAAGAAGIE
ncbi:MAG: tripartite tricarboxylate transporter substrate binding protein [Alphaproteobacteria bacterium]|nr:tripartite tricarboxylate transporter substrate binding protein [Alphaproteobacteria bacterium]